MRYINSKYTASQSTPKVNNAKPTKTKSSIQKRMLFKDALALLTHSSFRILSHHVAPDSNLNGYNSTGQQGTSNRTLKDALLRYQYRRAITTKSKWVRRSMS